MATQQTNLSEPTEAQKRFYGPIVMVFAVALIALLVALCYQ